MNKLMFFALFVCSVSFLHCCDAVSTIKRGYMFTAPKRLLIGETESGCLSLHNLELPARVVLELLVGPKDEVLTHTSAIMKTGVETCLQLTVPITKYTDGILRLRINFDKYPDYVVESKENVDIEPGSLLTFVETDKAIYKPGQDVNIRILMLKRDLKPLKTVIPKVWIENPASVRVAQWTNVSTENGMAQLTFPLSPEPNSGDWVIKVEKKSVKDMSQRMKFQMIHQTTFEVEKYILPRFQITIDSPEYILADVENVTWNICVKYSYGKPVKGTLLLKLTPRTPSWQRKPNFPAIRYETELNNPDGCTEFVLSETLLGLAHWKVDPNNIILIAEFTEAGTGIMQSAISLTRVVHEAFNLNFDDYMPKYFMLGLPYHGKLRVLRHDNTPVPNEKIQVCLSTRGKIDWSKNVVECRDFISSIDGFIDFVVPPQHKSTVLLTFAATAVDYPPKYYSPEKPSRVSMNQPSSYINIIPWYSPSDSYLVVARGNQPIVCGEKYSFNLMYTIPPNANESISFHYSINSKGSILIYGHVKHKPSRDTVLNYSEFRNILSAVEPLTNKTDDKPVVHRFPLSVKVTPSMAPISELLLYYVRLDGEVVATTYTIEVGHCFENKVKTAWHTDVQTPGSTTQYHVEAAPWSLCGISAIDKSTLFLSKSRSNLLNAAKIFDELRTFLPKPSNSFQIASDRRCRTVAREETNEEIAHFPPTWNLRKRRSRMITYDRSVKYVDATEAFSNFGVVVMSDLVLETRPCPWLFQEHTALDNAELNQYVHAQQFDFAVAAAAKDPGVVDDLPSKSPTLRSYFPETWLWELIPTGKEGKVTIERTLPHTITDWIGHTICISPTHGLGIAPPTAITAFQPFFLDYSLPYSVKRGEILHLKVSLFNHMQHSLPIMIHLEEVAGLDLHLSHPNASFCVKPRDSIVHEYILRPLVVGEVNITVSAFIDTDYLDSCGPDTPIFTRDAIVKPILILPEGFPIQETKSAFICPMNFSDDSMSMWELMLPKDILGPALDNLDNLVQLPKGCGEQNMVLFVPNIHVIKYLDANGIDNPVLRAKAIKNMEKGYQRQLTYKHSDDSYSAFTNSESSIWLTAFVLKSFAQARTLIHIDEDQLKRSVNWIIKKQLKNGCFPMIGTVFHKPMKGGLQKYDLSTALTAYILICLLESGVPLSLSIFNNALNCVENAVADYNTDPYTIILKTYALALSESPNANSSLKFLMKYATRHNNHVWWEDKSKPAISLSIEMTAYVILTLVKLGGDDNMIEAMKTVRWITKQMNTKGGYTSTQDTVIALEALTKYNMAVSPGKTDLSVLVTAKEVDYAYKLNEDNRMILKQIRLPVLPTIVEIFAEGKGCVLIQSNLKYNVAHTNASNAFDLSVGAHSAAYQNECSLQNITVCARYKMADEESNMALLEIGMISGYLPDPMSLNALLEDYPNKIDESITGVKRYDANRDVVTIYFDKLTGERTCISFTIIRENVVDRLEPANVKLYDYYQQELTVSTSYKIASLCSSAEPVNEQVTPSVQSEEQLQYALTINFAETFFKDSHELQTRVPVYEESYLSSYNNKYNKESSITTNGLPVVRTSTIATEDETMQTVQPEEQNPLQEESDVEMNNTTINTETNIPSPTGEKQSCPVCMDKLPSNIKDVYCSASSAVKVAIRRLRKARLLLDLHGSREVQRLRATVKYTLSPNCSCSPLDTPGSFALIINKDNDFLASGDHEQTLNDSFYIYGLPLVSGMPCKLAEVRATCFNEENIQCTYEDPQVYG
ncbi:PREDICTED: murinoglobulin-1-like [Habropoda laboriosa]|uniref:murinoglobulin-1-like n=1 Tax=Habropoda laboriosa TaxID=597456 RepID=UPI00083D708B|nr:PREDICTED: murinoglobulin-1-like [Habropoda laboriosa]